MTYKYSVELAENQSKAVGISLPISTKVSIEICKHIRGKKIEKAKKILDAAINLEIAIPYTRFNNDVGHKKGNIAAGRFPIKACTEIKKLVLSAEANAQFKGLSSDLIIKHISAKQGPKSWHYGRKKRRQMKKTHVELVLEEKAKESKK